MTDRVCKEMNYFCFPCKSLPGGLRYPDITLLIWGMEFLPSSLSDACPTRELWEEGGVAVPPRAFVALPGDVSLRAEQRELMLALLFTP